MVKAPILNPQPLRVPYFPVWEQYPTCKLWSPSAVVWVRIFGFRVQGLGFRVEGSGFRVGV